MCGIVGFVGDTERIGGAPTIAQMLAMIAHRGPDEAGYYIDDELTMGTSRLSIIDPGAGQQPISDDSGRYWICYNGEIYNYLELRKELIDLGVRLHTQCDTEVLLHAWIVWGPAVLPRLNGPFSFAIYDRYAKQVVLARDRFGVRPLFYTLRKGDLYFASELKSFLACPEFSFELDPDQLASIFSIWTPLETQTAFRNIEQLALGSYLTYHLADKRLNTQCYAPLSLDSTVVVKNQTEAQELIRAELERSVQLRMRSDVPVGSYLSGGLDSTIVTGLAAKHSSQPLNTFSIAFSDAGFDESAYQREAADYLNTRHTTLEVSDAQIVDAFPDTIWHAEVPIFRSAPVPMLLLSRCVRDAGIKVALTGEGADEAFLGYDIFKETMIRDGWSQRTEDERLQLIGKVNPFLGHFNSQNAKSLMSFFNMFAQEKTPGLFSHEMRFNSTKLARRLLNTTTDGLKPLRQAIEASGASFQGWSPVQRAQWLEYKTLLAGYLLSSQGDRMSMASGVEGRCPFLDPNVVSAAMSVNYRFDDGFDEKAILKSTFSDLLPTGIKSRRKQPYLAPDMAPFLKHRPDYLDALLSPEYLKDLGCIDSKVATLFLNRLSNSSFDRASPSESQAFLLLLSLAVLNAFFVTKTMSVGQVKSAPIVRIADMRSKK